MIITLDHIVDESPSIRTFYFAPERPVEYTAGQFIELTLKHAEPDDRGTRRWFTLSSSPTQKLIAITTRFAAESSSFKRALAALQPGDQAQISDPMGDFVLPKLIQTPLIFVAAGIGITPFHSMLQWLADTHETRPIQMLAGVQTEADIVFQELYDKLHQHVTIVVSKPSAAWGGLRGRLNAEHILGLGKVTPETLIYVSGPEEMVETLHHDLVQAGVKKHQLVGDYFPNYQTTS